MNNRGSLRKCSPASVVQRARRRLLCSRMGRRGLPKRRQREDMSNSGVINKLEDIKRPVITTDSQVALPHRPAFS